MTDLREELVDTIEDAMDNVHDMDVTFNQYASAAAYAILAKLRPVPLVWSEPSEDPYQHQMSGSYEVTDAGHLYFHEIERGDISTNLIARFNTIEEAKAAAEAHHIAAWRKAGGLDT